MTLERIPEPELMDTPEQARAYAEADFSAPHDRFVALFRECFPGEALAAAQVLDLGCGPADVTVRFAKAFPCCHITALDAGPNMLALARKAVTTAGLSDRVDLILGRLPQFPLSPSLFDGVISNSLLHHLADPAAIWHAIALGAKPGAAIFVMDLLRPADLPTLDCLVDKYTQGEPAILRQDFRNSLLAGYRVHEVEQQIHQAELPGIQVCVVSDRHWIAFGRLGGREAAGESTRQQGQR